jgi:signal transduction histidine kinase/ligand-binding sensor domain-containing protein
MPLFFRPGLAAVALIVAGMHGPDAVAGGDWRTGEFSFRRIGVAEGLAPDVLTTVYRDRAGLLWVGTREGLYRYDGRSVLRFVRDADDPGSISDNSIRTLFQDRRGRLWIGTNTGGLSRLDPGARRFLRLRSDSAREDTLSHDSVYAIAEDATGTLWVGTQVGLNRIDPESGAVERVPFDPGHPQGAGREYVTVLMVDSEDALWAGTVGRGLFRRAAGESAFTRIDPADGLTDPSIFSLMADAGGNIWAGGPGDVFVRPRGERAFRAVGLSEVATGSIDAITAIIETQEGRVLAGSYAVGIFEIDPKNFAARLHGTRPGQPGSLDDSRITGLVIDPGGGLVASTWGGGLQRTSFSTRQFGRLDSFVDATGLPVELQDVLAVAGNADTGIWVGSNSRGLMRLSDQDDGLKALPYPIGDPSRPPAVFSVRPERADRIWVGLADGLLDYRPGVPAGTLYSHEAADATTLGPGYVTTLVQGPDGSLWVGTGGSGVYLMQPDGSFAGHAHRPDAPLSLSGDYVTALALDEAGALWVGTRSRGLNRCRPSPFECSRHEVGAPGGLRHHYVTVIHRDREGDFWVGTAGGGLHRARRVADGRIDGFDHYGVDEGLVDDNVTAIVDDDDGSLWVATRNGLSRLSEDRSSFHNYLAGDGLVSDIFNRGAVARDEGRLYFGTVDGLAYLDAGTPFTAPPPAEIVFTEARDLTAGRALAGIIWDELSLSVAHGSVLQFGYTLLDYEAERHSYAYRLNASSDWIDIDNSRQLTFGDLPPGRHELEIRGRSARGQWSVAAVPIDVVPPFWMSQWFRMFVVVGLLLAGFWAHTARIGALRKRNRELLSLHLERERALEKLRRSELELSEAARGLRRLAERLETAKEEERQHISRELHDELGQTLTAAKISLQLAGREIREDAPTARLEAAVGMMDSMIGQVRTISLNLRPPLLDEAGLVPALRHELEQASRHTGVPLSLTVSDDFPDLPPELETVIFRVTQEAISNSLRHADATRIRVALDFADGELGVVIEDDGCGFDVDEVRARAMRGEHLGLLGLDERVIAVGGTAKLDARPGHGTRLSVRIPLEATA